MRTSLDAVDFALQHHANHAVIHNSSAVLSGIKQGLFAGMVNRAGASGRKILDGFYDSLGEAGVGMTGVILLLFNVGFGLVRKTNSAVSVFLCGIVLIEKSHFFNRFLIVLHLPVETGERTPGRAPGLTCAQWIALRNCRRLLRVYA